MLQAQEGSSALAAQVRSLLEAGRIEDAERVTRNYLQEHQHSGEAHFLLGYVLFKQQRAKESLAEYTEGARYRRPEAFDLAAVGGDYVLLNDYSDADKWFTKAEEWNPGNFQILYYLARTKYNENRFEEAVSLFLQCLKLDPKNVKAEDNLGLSYQGLGRMDEAAQAFQKAIDWEKQSSAPDAGPYLDLGSLLVAGDRAAEAIPLLHEALKRSPEDVRAHRELGKAYLHAKQLTEAREELERSVKLAPDDAPTHFVLAQVYRKLGMADRAEAETQLYSRLSKDQNSSSPR